MVDEDNQVVDKRPRDEVHQEELPHRSVMFFVRAPNGKILVTKRSEDKEFFPGHWSIVLGGHVEAGDSYEQSLRKEMREEIGMVGEYEKVGSFVKDIAEEKEYVQLYETVVDPREIELLPDEFEEGKFWTLEKIRKELSERDFLPETEDALKFADDLQKI